MTRSVTYKSDFQCSDTKDHWNHTRKAVVMGRPCHPQTQHSRYWGRRVLNTRAPQHRLPIEIDSVLKRKEEGRRGKEGWREEERERRGGALCTEPICGQFLWYLHQFTYLTSYPSTMIEPSLDKSLWPLSDFFRIRVTTGGLYDYSTYYMRKTNVWIRIRYFSF